MGFNDVISLTNAILDALETGSDVGSPLILKHYEKDRFLMNSLMLGGVDSLQRLFSINFLPLGLARNEGLSLTDSIVPLKRKLADLAVGRDNDLSRIGPGKTVSN